MAALLAHPLGLLGMLGQVSLEEGSLRTVRMVATAPTFADYDVDGVADDVFAGRPADSRAGRDDGPFLAVRIQHTACAPTCSGARWTWRTPG